MTSTPTTKRSTILNLMIIKRTNFGKKRDDHLFFFVGFNISTYISRPRLGFATYATRPQLGSFFLFRKKLKSDAGFIIRLGCLI